MNQNSILKQILLPAVLLVIAIVLAAGFIYGLRAVTSPAVVTPTPQPVPSPTPTPTPQPVDISDWQTYRNDDLGFEIKYPGTLVEVCGLPHQVGTKENPEYWDVGPLSILVYGA